MTQYSFSSQSASIVADRNLVSIGTEFKGTDSLLVEGKQDQKFYAATDTSSSQTSTESSSNLLGFITLDKSSDTQKKAQTQALGSKLISDKAITVNIGKSADFSGAELSGDTVSFKNLDESKPGSLILGGALESASSSTSSSSETLGLWQKTSDSGSSTQDLKMTSIKGAVQFDEGLKVAVQLPDVVSTSGKAANPNAGQAPSIRDANQASVQSQIETLSQQPGLGYLKQLMEGNAGAGSTNTNTTTPKVQWSQVQLAHDNWKFEQQGLTPAGAALLSIAIAAYTGGMGAELLGTTRATATGTATTLGGVTLGTTTAATATASTYAAGAALNAGFTALASQTAVAMVNNGGDIGKTLEQLGSDQSIKNLLTTMATAGALHAMNTAIADARNSSASTAAANGQSGAAASGVNGVSTTQAANAFTQNLTRNLTNNLAGAVVDSAINNKPLNADTLANALKSALITSGMASGANAIGDAAAQNEINSFTQKVAHAVIGCAGGAATTGNSGGCSAGAVGAVVGEMAAGYYMDKQQDPKLSLEQNKANALAFAKVVSAASGIVAGGGGDNVAAVNVATTTGANAAENNCIIHKCYLFKPKPEGGFVTSGAANNGLYAQQNTLDTLDKIGQAWKEFGIDKPLVVTEISKEVGPTPGHKSHQEGQDVDIRPLRVTGSGPVTYKDSNYDPIATQKAVDAILKISPDAIIYFNDPKIKGVKTWPGHDDHLHISFP